MQHLEDTVDNQGFKGLVKNLRRAATNISLKKAFEELIGNKENFHDRRKEETERLISKKIGTAQFFLSVFPLITMVVFYMIIPILYIAIGSLENLQIDKLMS